MTTPFQPKAGQRPGTSVPGGDRARPAGTGPAPAAGRGQPLPPPKSPQGSNSGRVTHDSRGNAIWDWVKTTGRQAIDSTSRLLKKLETPELKVEDTQEKELRILPDGAPGGGYDPYNQVNKKRK